MSACARARIEWQRLVEHNGRVCFVTAEPVEAIGVLLAGRSVDAYVVPGLVDQALPEGALPSIRTPTILTGIIRRPPRTPYLAILTTWDRHATDESTLYQMLLARAGRQSEFRTPEEAKAAVEDLLTGADVSHLITWSEDGVWAPAQQPTRTATT